MVSRVGDSLTIKNLLYGFVALAILSYVPFALLIFSSMNEEDSSNGLELSHGMPMLPLASWTANLHNASGKQFEEMQQRMDYLESKVNAYLAFGEDPFRGMKESASAPECIKSSNLEKYSCMLHPQKCAMNHKICLDNLLPAKGPSSVRELKVGAGEDIAQPKPQCLVYDFGIEDDNSFGEVLSNDPFLCNVFAFDPSPIAMQRYKRSWLKNHQRYTLHPFGGGGINGDLALRQYKWNETTILQYPAEVVNENKCDNTSCEYKKFPIQREVLVPVRTLKSIMDELGHDRISILKLDVEGSEYAFLEAMIEDLSCRRVDELTVAWHHHHFDNRYGVSSSPHINVLVALLEKRCGLFQWWVYDESGGWPATTKRYAEMGITLRYNFAGFRRRKATNQAWF